MSERSTIARHAGTVLVGQLAVMAYGVTDTLVAARHSSEALAALSVGSAVYISIFVALNGMLQALLPVWAEHHGAGRQAGVGHSFRQSLYLYAALVVIGIAALLCPGPLLRWTQVPPALQPDVTRYLAVLALALPAALGFRLYSTLNQALGKPLLVTWLQVGSLFVKAPLSIWLTFGGGGLPSLGVAGCAWATLCVSAAMMIMALWLLRTEPMYHPYRLWKRLEPPHWPTLRAFARLGIPTALSIMVEVTSFTLMALFIARMGTVAAASHQIASNVTAMLYMVPLSLSIATSARVSYWLGAQDPLRARQALRAGLHWVLALALALAVGVAAAHHWIAALYAADRREVVTLAGSLLLWVAVYHLADASQAFCVFILRCYRIATAPLVVYCVLLWGIGLVGGYMLAYPGGQIHPQSSPADFWAMGALALVLTAVTLAGLLVHAVRRFGLPR